MPVFVPAVTPRGRACCQTSCGVSACRTSLSSTLTTSWLCTLPMPAWDGTPWMRWARARARCPGPRAPLHGRVSPHNTHLPHDISSSFTQRNTELYSAWIHSSCVCSWLTDPERDDEDFLYLTSEQDWDYFSQVESCDLKHCRVGRKGGERRVAEGRQCKEDRAGVKTCDSSGRGGLEGGLFVSRCTAGWLTVWVQAVSWIQRDTETMKSRGRVVHFNMYNAFFFFFFLFIYTWLLKPDWKQLKQNTEVRVQLKSAVALVNE